MKEKEYWEKIENRFQEKPQETALIQLLGTTSSGRKMNTGLLLLFSQKIVFHCLEKEPTIAGLPLKTEGSGVQEEYFLEESRDSVKKTGQINESLALGFIENKKQLPSDLKEPGKWQLFSRKLHYISFDTGEDWFFSLTNNDKILLPLNS